MFEWCSKPQSITNQCTSQSSLQQTEEVQDHQSLLTFLTCQIFQSHLQHNQTLSEINLALHCISGSKVESKVPHLRSKSQSVVAPGTEIRLHLSPANLRYHCMAIIHPTQFGLMCTCSFHFSCRHPQQLILHYPDFHASYVSFRTNKKEKKWKCQLLSLFPTLCDPTDYSPLGFSVHGILQARTLKWVAISFSRKSSQPGN